MKTRRMVWVILLLLPMVWHGATDAQNLQEAPADRIVFFVR